MFISALLIHKHTTFVHPVLLQEASELSSLLPHLRAAEYKLYAVVHEKRGVEEFRPFFKGDIFLDEEVIIDYSVLTMSFLESSHYVTDQY